VRAYRQTVILLAALMIALGLAMIVVTLTRGFGVGVVLGALFTAAGVGRLTLLLRRR
jgi:hypothetical protein